MPLNDEAMWNGLFHIAKKSEDDRIAEKNKDGVKKYRFLGEIDCPEELYSFTWVSKDLIDSIHHKTNWFSVSDGTYFHVSDFGVDSIFESGNCQFDPLPIEIERDQKYKECTLDEKIKFRMDIQNMPYQMAREMVYFEAGLNPYKYQYKVKVSEHYRNSHTNEVETFEYTCDLCADTDEDVLEKAKETARPVGSIVEEGHRFNPGSTIYNRYEGIYYKVTVESVEVSIISKR